ncbi:MAG: glutamate racemase [Saprospiraceae bacterium]|nr:glutamate racemase [Saprospiraceae bacterium]
MSEKKIAFFDSGVGGLTVLSDALEVLPNEYFIYFADTDNVPYGKKAKKEIARLVKDSVSFLAKQKLKALVIACNTATSAVIKDLRKKYDFPIIGMEPAIKPALEIYKDHHVLLCATKRTLKEKKLKKLVRYLMAKERIEKMSLQKLVLFAEENKFDTPEVRKYLKKKFSDVDWTRVKALVLGCTHFIFYRDIIASLIPEHVHVVDGNTGTVKRLISLIQPNDSSVNSSVEYYCSGRKVNEEYFKGFIDIYRSTKSG